MFRKCLFSTLILLVNPLALFSQVWFVKNDFQGKSDGTQANPFTTILEAEKHSKPFDVIYLFAGDGTTKGYDTGIQLKDGQRLLGSGRQHLVLTNEGASFALDGGKDFPLLTSSVAGKPAVLLANGCEVAGIRITGTHESDAIFGSDMSHRAPHFFGITNTHIHHNIIDECLVAKGAITLYNCQGELLITDNIIKNIAGISTVSAIDVANALVPINTTVHLAHNTISGGTDYGVSIIHNAPGGGLHAIIEGNTFKEFSDHAALFFGSKKMVSCGVFTADVQENLFETSRYGIETVGCGSLHFAINIRKNHFSENSLGNLLAQGFNKSHSYILLSENQGDKAYIFKNISPDSTMQVQLLNQRGEIVKQGSVVVREEG